MSGPVWQRADPEVTRARIREIQQRQAGKHPPAAFADLAELEPAEKPLLSGLTAIRMQELRRRNPSRRRREPERSKPAKGAGPAPASPARRGRSSAQQSGAEAGAAATEALGRPCAASSRVPAIQFTFADLQEGGGRPRSSSVPEWTLPTKVVTWGAVGASVPASTSDGSLGLKGRPEATTLRIPCASQARPAGSAAVSLCSGADNILMVTASGSLLAFGEGACVVEHSMAAGGRVVPTPVHTPTLVALPVASITDVSAGTEHCVAVESGTGTVVTWGAASGGRLGRSTRPKAAAAASEPERAKDVRASVSSIRHLHRYSAPSPIGPLVGIRVTAVSCGDAHSLALDEQGRVWAWGANGAGQCGIGPAHGDVFEPVRTMLHDSRSPPPRGRRAVGPRDGSAPSELTSTRVFAVSAGEAHSALVTGDGAVWTAGSKAGGRLGAGRDSDSHVLRMARSTVPASAAAPLLADSNPDSPWRAPKQDRGEEHPDPGGYRGGSLERRWFCKVRGLPLGAVAVSCGRAHTLVLDTDGRVWAFGSSEHGQTGRPPPVTDPDAAARASRAVATEAQAERAARQAFDDASTAATRAEREALAKQAGAGAALLPEVPMEVRSLAMLNAVCGSVAAGWAVSAATDHRGRIWTWGANVEGTLGRASASWARHKPGLAELPRDMAFVSVSAGRRHAAAVAFRMPPDLPSPDSKQEPAEPIWQSLGERGVPVSTALLDRVPRQLASDWTDRTRQRLRAIRFASRVEAATVGLKRRRALCAAERKSQAARSAVPPLALSTRRGAATRLPAMTQGDHSVLGPASAAVARRSGLERIAAHRCIGSTLYLLARLAGQRKKALEDDSIVGIHQAAAVLQQTAREFTARRRLLAAVRRKERSIVGERAKFQQVAKQAARLGARLSRARVLQQDRIAAAAARKSQREREQSLAEAAADLAAIEESHVRQLRNRKARTRELVVKLGERRALQAASFRAARASTAGAVESKEVDRPAEHPVAPRPVSLRSKPEPQGPEFEQSCMEHEEAMSYMAERGVWAAEDQQRKWRLEQPQRLLEREAEEAERACMAEEEKQTRRANRALRHKAQQRWALRKGVRVGAASTATPSTREADTDPAPEPLRTSSRAALRVETGSEEAGCPSEGPDASATLAEVAASQAGEAEAKRSNVVQHEPQAEAAWPVADAGGAAFEESSWVGYVQDGWMWDGWQWVPAPAASALPPRAAAAAAAAAFSTASPSAAETAEVWRRDLGAWTSEAQAAWQAEIDAWKS